MKLKEFEEFVAAHWDHVEGGKLFDDGTGMLVGGESMSIMALGLAGESGEAVEHIKKFIRDGEINLDAFQLELGDTLYYLIALHVLFGFDPRVTMAMNVEKLTERRKRRAN